MICDLTPKFILLLAVVAWKSAELAGAAGLDVGSPCYSSDGSKGKCVLLNDCPAMVDDLEKNNISASRSFQSCGKLHNGGGENTPIVCCKTIPLRKSEKACENYKKEFLTTISKDFIPAIENRVANGDEADPHEFPHMVALGYKVEDSNDIQWNCGGSLISENHILTAAHCGRFNKKKTLVAVRLGAHNLTVNPTENGDTVFNIQKQDFILHPKRKGLSWNNDIAIIKIPTVHFTPRIYPACLYSSPQAPQSGLSVAGWGRTRFTSAIPSDVLRKAFVNETPLQMCGQSYSQESVKRLPNGIIPEMICAYNNKTNADTCKGDSGGPLQVQVPSSSGLYSVVGVTSFGKACGTGFYPGVYTRVSSYLNWIESTVWPDADPDAYSDADSDDDDDYDVYYYDTDSGSYYDRPTDSGRAYPGSDAKAFPE